MLIQLLGVGCSKYRQLRSNLDLASTQLKLALPIVEIDDVQRFIEEGISLIPCLKINGSIVSKGRIPSVDELVEVLRQGLVSENKISV